MFLLQNKHQHVAIHDTALEKKSHRKQNPASFLDESLRNPTNGSIDLPVRDGISIDSYMKPIPVDHLGYALGCHTIPGGGENIYHRIFKSHFQSHSIFGRS